MLGVNRGWRTISWPTMGSAEGSITSKADTAWRLVDSEGPSASLQYSVLIHSSSMDFTTLIGSLGQIH